MRAAALTLLLGLVGCDQPTAPWNGQPGSTEPNAAGLVTLPCDGSTPLEPVKAYHCREGRHFVTPSARGALIHAAEVVQARYPGERLRFMDASGQTGSKPFEPHLSHGDGHQIDLALYYTDIEDRPLHRFPDTRRYGGHYPAEPPRPGEQIACPGGRKGRAEKPDPPADRPWRLDEARTALLIQTLVDDPRVERVLLEPHLERRLGFWGHPKVRFAGCQAARHDDHIHVDFR